MKKSKLHLIQALPKTAEKKYHLTDPAVVGFMSRINQTQDEDLYEVIDHMFVYYTQVVRELQRELNHIYENSTPQDIARLREGYKKPNNDENQSEK